MYFLMMVITLKHVGEMEGTDKILCRNNYAFGWF